MGCPFYKFNTEIHNTLIVSIFRRHEPKTEYEIEQEALTHAFAGNTFDKLHNKKYGGHYDQDDQEDRVEMEMGKMVEKRTKMLWDVSLQVCTMFCINF